MAGGDRVRDRLADRRVGLPLFLAGGADRKRLGGAVSRSGSPTRLVAPVFGLLAAILWIRHSENIRRLMSGSETRIGAKG